jgi:carboxyl-terminal processing protease
LIRRRILVAVLIAALFALGWWSGREGGRGELYANVDRFVEVLHKVDENYVEPVDPERVVTGAIQGMLQTLDPYSQFLDAKEYSRLQEMTHGSFTGVGLEVGIRDHFPTVIAPIEGGPAWEAGIQTGDAIIKVDDRSTADFTFDRVASALRGPAGTRVKVTIQRDGEPGDRDIDLTRREIVVTSVPYAFVTEGGVGYVRISRMAEDTDARLRESLARLRSQGAKSLVIDLRRNPGGLLDQAVQVTEHFVPRGSEIVSTRGRNTTLNRRYVARDNAPETQWPMAVLVDQGSASASEIVAGALQDLDRALVVGQGSFGKGSVQNVFPIPGGQGAVKLTTALYYTPSGRSIHHRVADETPADPLVDEDDDPDDRPDSVSTSTAPRDTARPAFHTASGRTVLGGGGITPDVLVAADTLGRLATEFERRGLALRFSRRWDTERPLKQSALPEPGAVWPELLTFLRAERLSASPESLAAERIGLVRVARRELARRRDGDAGAARVMLAEDPVFRRASDTLRRAHAPADVFAYANPATPGAAGTPAASRPSPASRKRPASYHGPVRRH